MTAAVPTRRRTGLRVGRLRPFTLILLPGAAGALAFLVIPILALFTESPPGPDAQPPRTTRS